MTTEYRPRDDLIRMVELPVADVEFRADADGPTLGTLHGYAAIFNEWTEINSWEGRFRERIAPGAFRKTLKEFGDRVKILFNHGFDPSIGDKPLGKPRVIEEDNKGLRVEVPLDDTSYNRDLVASLRSGALDGMSFRFSVSREDWAKEDTSMPERTIREVARLFEAGPVTFPAYEATTAGVRAREAYQAWRTAHPNGGPVESGTEHFITNNKISADKAERHGEIDPDSPDPQIAAKTDAAQQGTSDRTDDTPPLEAPVEQEARQEEPADMPVRQPDEKVLAAARARLERFAKL